jgi:hypothetical protein
MGLAAGILVTAGTRGDATGGATHGGVMVAYVVGFVALFIISGIGNGSVYKMIPVIFAAKSIRLTDLTPVDAAAWARTMSGALIGIAGAVGALGGVGINLVLRASYAGHTKSATNAFWIFLGFYLVCVALTWLVYVRPATHWPADKPNSDRDLPRPHLIRNGRPLRWLSPDERSDAIMGGCGYRRRQIRGHASSGSCWPQAPDGATASRRYWWMAGWTLRSLRCATVDVPTLF